MHTKPFKTRTSIINKEYHTEHGTIYYEGPGWYAYGLRVGEDKERKPLPKSFWVDLDHEQEVATMVAEGCPHCHEEPIPPEACQPTVNKVSLWQRIKNWFRK